MIQKRWSKNEIGILWKYFHSPFESTRQPFAPSNHRLYEGKLLNLIKGRSTVKSVGLDGGDRDSRVNMSQYLALLMGWKVIFEQNVVQTLKKVIYGLLEVQFDRKRWTITKLWTSFLSERTFYSYKTMLHTEHDVLVVISQSCGQSSKMRVFKVIKKTVLSF